MSTTTRQSDSDKADRRSAVTQRRRDKSTRKSVLLMDRAAGWGITIGGLLVIFAVIGIMVFLVKVALPLSGGGDTLAHAEYELPAKRTLWLNADEYGTLGVRVAADGAYRVFHLASGRFVTAGQLDFGGQSATAVGGVVERDQVAFAFADGTIRFAELTFEVDILRPSDVTAVTEVLDQRDRLAGDAVYSSLPGDQLRRVRLRAEVQEPTKVVDAPIVAVAYRVGGTAERPTRSFVTVDAEGVGRLSRATAKLNIMTRKLTTKVRTTELPPLPEGTRVTAVALNTLADTVLVASDRGRLYRFDARDFSNPVLSETVDAFPSGATVTTMDYLVGEQALVVGGSNGAVHVYFKLSPEQGAAPDGYKLVRSRVHEPHGAAVTGISVSQRSKTLTTEAANGEVWVRHSTSDQVLLRYDHGGVQEGSAQLLLLPRVDGVVRVADSGETDYWSFYYPHPETTLDAVFGKVWYEGYEEPTYTWQSSSGTDVFEPKYSLVPLIFGTLKATIYSLVFAIPIGLLGAIYTSEFVHHRVRATVKPMMETMESMPTVVVGFIAALVLAPIVETWIAAVLLAFVALPMGLMLAAFLWQLLPLDVVLKLDGLPKFFLMFVVIALSLYVAYGFGPAFERVFFYDDFMAWTNGDIGTGTPFMFLVLLPVGFFAARWLVQRVFGDRLRNYQRGLTKSHAGGLEFLRWVGLLIGAVVLSLATASILTAAGFDPRGGVVDTYVQRNALVVGFVMGFAIIPTIYSLSEDALSAVPNHVRSASLAAGATPWQTAIWVILPTALSGVFAACMIGMGRAVGETMIVLMAAGNTPVLDWNIFNGLRTLSANIAVELPEAPQDGTHYRMLFLAGLTLFVLTFTINTVAETIRQRFRKRAFQL
ncbi:MAG: ABC transporter permease subunit [Gammaproteobacteria bacterium]|nr:ABC transporter permease subunit [Gammaproteobacteria bacterium]